MRHGGAANRSGSKFICEVSDSSKRVRLIPFIFNNQQTYVLEFGDGYMRVIKDGVQQTLAAQNITAITNANPAVLTYSGSDTYANGDEVYISGVVGMTEVNGRNFKVANVNTGSNTFELDYMDGTNVNSTAWGTYVSGGTVEEVYEIDSPYAEADLQEIQFVQSADVITLVHPSYPIYTLSRLGDTSWTLEELDLEPESARPTSLSASAGGAGAATYDYRVTAIQKETFEESFGAITASIASITAITAASPAEVTTGAAHGLGVNETVYIDGIVGTMSVLNGKEYRIGAIAATTFELYNLDGTNVDTTSLGYTSGGSVHRPYARITSAAAPTTGAPHTVQWTTTSDMLEFNVYRRDNTTNGIFGWIGISNSGLFRDTGALAPDTEDIPPEPRDIFIDTDDYPSTVAYYQQRLMVANTNNEPEKIWGSRTGRFSNFTYSKPIQDDDAVTFILSGNQVNAVKHLIDLGKLVVLTQGGEWTVQGDASGALTPSDINARQYSYNGSSNLRPLVIGNTALYVQARGNIVRDLAFDIGSDGYRGVDLTVYSNHLVDGYTLTDWAYAQVPESIVWAVRDDGTLLGLTYVKEQQMLAWHRHDTDGGIIENICVVPEDNEDVLYWVVKRTINAKSVRYIERVGSRFILESEIKDATHLDSFLSYDGRNTNTSHTMTLTSGGGWTYQDTLTLTSSTSYFATSDVGNEIHLTGASGDIIRCSITAYTSGTVVSVTPNRTVPANMRSAAISSWGYAVDSVSGLWHLEGENVSIFADGYVVANPNNDAYVTATVSDGEVSLDDFYTVIHVGLPITADIETLDIDTAQGETLADKKMIVTGVTLFLEKSRGLWVGGREPESSVLDGMTELKIREAEGYDEPVDLLTGKVSVNIESTWNSNGRVFVRQTDPVPASILAIAPAGMFPVRG